MAGPLLNTTAKMAPITIGETFKDPRAAILYGGGNAKISDNDIRSFINSGKSNDEILRTALQHGVSADQISKAMGGQKGFDNNNIKNYLTSSTDIDLTKNDGVTIDMGQAMAPYIEELEAIKAERVKPTNVAVNPKTDTVSGQLDQVLDPNSPLMKRAGTMGDQLSNKRGLLNSSIGIGASQAAMTDAALQIATPDAQMFSQSKLENARAANTASLANAENRLTSDMFNADMGFKVRSTNAANQIEVSKFNAENINRLISQYFDIDSKNRLQQMDNENRLALASIDTKNNASSAAYSFYNNMAQRMIDILSSDSPNKDALLENALSLTKGGIDMISAAAGLDELDFSKLFPGSSAETGETAKLLLNTGSSGSSTGTKGVSALTNEELGPSKLRPEQFNTLSGKISTTAAETLKNAYQIDPRFIINPFDPDIVGFQYGGTMSIPGATRPSKLGQEKMFALRDGIANGTIAKIPVRDPNYGVLLDPSFAEFDQPDLYYDPNNTLGLAS